MARIVRHTEQAPLRIPMAEIKGDLYLCRCGLSQNGAFCDGSHKATRDEAHGSLYHYQREDGALRRNEVAPAVPVITVPAPATPDEAAPLGGAN